MKLSNIALLAAAVAIGAGCASKETKPEAAPQAAAAPAPVEQKAVKTLPDCPPAKTTGKKSKKDAKASTPECKPTTTTAPKAAASPAPAPAVAAPAATPAAAPAPSEPGKPRVVKSRDGTFEGEIHGNIPAGSKWAKLQIGMHQSEVERILGATPNIRGYVTGKAFIPFYFGTDSHRYEAVYAGQGSVAYTGGGMGGGQGVLMMINYDPKIQ